MTNKKKLFIFIKYTKAFHNSYQAQNSLVIELLNVKIISMGIIKWQVFTKYHHIHNQDIVVAILYEALQTIIIFLCSGSLLKATPLAQLKVKWNSRLKTFVKYLWTWSARLTSKRITLLSKLLPTLKNWAGRITMSKLLVKMLEAARD